MKYTLLLFLFALSACIQAPIARLAQSSDWVLSEDVGGKSNCLSSESFKIDSTHLDFWPIKYVRLAFHVMDKESNPYKVDTLKAPKSIQALVDLSNANLQKRQKLFLPEGNDFPATPVRMRYVIAPDVDQEKKGIYYHYDEDMPYHVHRGKNQNRGNGQIFKKYAYRNDSILNVFIISHHPDSVASKTYKNSTSGVAFGARYIKLIGEWHKFENTWSIHKSLLHEVGHIYTLNHSWVKNDGCDDTPSHKNCWNYNEPEGCSVVSNNIMDYSAHSIAFSPCQVGRMHAAIAKEGSQQRKYLRQNWCRSKGRTVELRDTFILNHATDLEGSLTLLPGAYLEVRCRLSIPQGDRITVQPGATLALAGGKLHNSCGLPWEGIFVEEKGRREKGELKLLGGGSIENALGGASLPNEPTSSN